jgi:hypothetical protein
MDTCIRHTWRMHNYAKCQLRDINIAREKRRGVMRPSYIISCTVYGGAKKDTKGCVPYILGKTIS